MYTVVVSLLCNRDFKKNLYNAGADLLQNLELLGGPIPMGGNSDGVESLQSRMILTMSHWSSGLTCLLPVTSVTGSNPLGVLK
jgi:hypothetical protein